MFGWNLEENLCNIELDQWQRGYIWGKNQIIFYEGQENDNGIWILFHLNRAQKKENEDTL